LICGRRGDTYEQKVLVDHEGGVRAFLLSWLECARRTAWRHLSPDQPVVNKWLFPVLMTFDDFLTIFDDF
jgi:hypothetical protein